MDINLNDLIEGCMQTIDKKMKNLNKLNIVVVGKTGVGKSTLINNIFRERLVETGTGAPVTAHMVKITKEDFPLTIYDTRGFELGQDSQREIRNELLEKIKEGSSSGDINKAIHCVWYCVSATSSRFEPQEMEWIKAFTEESSIYHIPVIVVLTQAYGKKAQEMKKYIESLNMHVIQVVPVLAEDMEINDEYCVKAYGLDTLIEIMQEALPNEMVDTLMSVQQVNLKLKQKRAQAAVAAGAVAAAAAGAAPIPFADAAVLAPTEITMLASITAIFGFDISKAVLTTLISSIVGTSGATFAGKAIVSNLFKLIPGLGTLAGGAISAATASTMTIALGEAYIGVMTAMFKGEITPKDLETKQGKQKITDMFKKELKQKR